MYIEDKNKNDTFQWIKYDNFIKKTWKKKIGLTTGISMKDNLPEKNKN